MYLRYVFYAVVALVGFVVTYVLALPMAALSVALGRPTLPGWLALMHTNDDDLDGGQHQLGWPPKKGFGLVLQRTKWIWRNPNYGFNDRVLGLPTDGLEVVYETASNPNPAAIHWDGHNGYRKIIWRRDGRYYFSYRRDIPLWGKRFMKVWLGWQYDDKNNDGVYMLKVMFNPFRNRED